jgi:hypothetical protein
MEEAGVPRENHRPWGSWIIEQLIQAYHQYSVFSPVFVNYKKGCTRLAAASDKVYQLLAHGRWFSLGTPASSITKTGHHDIAETLLKVALNTINQINQIKSNTIAKHYVSLYVYCLLLMLHFRVITKLPNSEQSYKGKVKTHKYIKQNQSTTGKL